MRAEILTVGDEILTGKIVDTNSSLVIRKLLAAGVPVRRIQTCGDDEADLVATLAAAVAAADLLVVVGGLGPTDDDRTTSAAARVFGRKLVRDERSLALLKERFAAYAIPFTANNEKQAWFPEGATILTNTAGTAPGFAMRDGEKLAFFLPGPPREVEPMLDLSVVPMVRTNLGFAAVVRPRVYKTFGLTESQLDATIAGKPLDLPGCAVGMRAHFPEIHLHVTVEAENADEADRLAREADAWARGHLGDLIFSDEPDRGLEDIVVGLLIARAKTLALAESCTGGMIGEMITRVPGASDVFDRGCVVYSNTAKTDLLGVPETLLAEHGAVSEACAVAMARGARERAGTDLAVAVTGIAGPGGGTPEKPVGTVFIALTDGGRTACRPFGFRGGRPWVRTLSAYAALDGLRRLLIGGEPWGSSAYLSRWQSRKT
jgi:nicotinamide-nucleotide amidase